MIKQICRLFVLTLLLASGSVCAANYVCGQDLNGDGEISDSSEYQSCVSKNVEMLSNPTASCRAGYTITGDHCEKTTTTPVVIKCSAGTYNNATGKCESTTTQNKTPQCSSGTYNNVSGKCETAVVTAKTETCPAGYTNNNNGTCSITQTATATVSCASGAYNTTLQQCVTTSTTTKLQQCPAGYTNTGQGTCVAYSYTDKVTVCDPDYTYSDKWATCRKLLYTNEAIGQLVYCTSSDAQLLAAETATQDSFFRVNGGSACTLLSKKYAVKAPSYACPSGYTSSGSTCQKVTASVAVVLVCPAGYTSSGATTCSKNTYSTPTYTCPAAYSYNNGMCYQYVTVSVTATCPAGSVDNGTSCVTTTQTAPNWICPTGFTSASATTCAQTTITEAFYECPAQYVRVGMSCTLTDTTSIIYQCEIGSTLNMFAPTCGSGYKYNYQFKLCQKETATSPASSGSCVSKPKETATEGGYFETWSADSCTLWSKKFVTTAPTFAPACTKSASEYYCPIGVNSDCLANNGGAGCSANQCVDIEKEQPTNDGSIDGTMLVDDGKKNSEGECLDQMFIFSGRGQDCKLPGVSNAFKDCCKSNGKALQDSAGSFMSTSQKISAIKNIYGAASEAYTAYNAAIAAGETAAAATNAGVAAAQNYMMVAFDPTSLAISIAIYVVMEYVMKACDPTSMETALLNDSGFCHYVGKYCAKKIKMIGCVQKAKSYCCFNSKLARIIHEQGRPQLSTGINTWGTPGAPLCRGFTPEEFQAVDFGQIDLTEYIDEIQKTAQDQIQKNMENMTNEFIEQTN